MALDEHLFNPSPTAWLVIDANNSAVPRIAVSSLHDGLDLVGKGRIAALVGHLRQGVGVVDVDVPGDFGDFLAAEITDWLRRHGCWVLQRPSGGARGRWHVFFAHTDFRYAPAAARTGFAADVSDYLASLAADVNVPARELDLRDAVRPLSSPHRHGATTRPKGDLRQALRALKRVHPLPPATTTSRRRAKTTTADPAGGARSSTNVSAMLLQRWKRDLRPDWRRYLLTGEVPSGNWSAARTLTHNADNTGNAATADRSLIEAACTRELVWAVGDPQTAWRLVRESHPSAMTKAKHQGWSWWITYVWNPLVRTASDLAAERPAERQPDAPAAPPDADTVAAVAAARDKLTALMWTVPARQRPALLLVGHHIVDRVARTGRLRVPCPERDLQLDTGLNDRKTIRNALRLLNGHLGTLHTDCLSPTERASTSFEFEINSASLRQGREIPPPAFHPPPAPRGLWATLPRASHSLWRTLQASATPANLEELATNAGLIEDPTRKPSKSQRATCRGALTALSRAGLAQVDEHGRWRAASRPRPVEIEQRASAAHTRLLAVVEAERTAYRAGLTASWTAGRAQALKLQRAKQRAWWDNMSPAARAARAAAKQLEFNQMSITQQEELKARLAERRILAGLAENDVYQTWLRGLHSDELAARSLDRKRRFESLTSAERGAAVAAWNRHRRRYGLTTTLATAPTAATSSSRAADEQSMLLPNGPNTRDAAYLESQGSLFSVGAARSKAG